MEDKWIHSWIILFISMDKRNGEVLHVFIFLQNAALILCHRDVPCALTLYCHAYRDLFDYTRRYYVIQIIMIWLNECHQNWKHIYKVYSIY